jgi:hypothetical protein
MAICTIIFLKLCVICHLDFSLGLCYNLINEREVVQMFYGKLKDFLKDIKIWVVADNGWYYSLPIAVTLSFEEAKQVWEEKTKLNWDIINDNETLKSNYFKSSNYEGHWYYSIEEKTLFDLYKVYEERAKTDAFFEKRDEIIKSANDSLRFDIRQECKEEYKKMFARFIKEIEETY